MKKLITSFLILATSLTSKSQYVTLADPDFRDLLIALYPSCFSSFPSLQLDTTCSAIVNAQYLNLDWDGGGALDSIENLDGLQYFKSLNSLDITGFTQFGNGSIPISFIPPLSKTLRYFTCHNTRITSLPFLPDSLIEMDIRDNNFITNIASLPSKLEKLTYIQQYNITLTCTIPGLPNGLRKFTCWGFDTVYFPQPEMPDSLRYLYYTNSTTIDFPALNDSLSYLAASPNCINQITAFPYGLDTIRVVGNGEVLNLPALPGDLKYLDVSYSENLCLPHLPPFLKKLNIPSSGSIHCLPNAVAGLQVIDPFPITLPLCNPTNNINHCNALPVISGKLFYDLNSNGTKEPAENYRANVEVYTNAGSHAFTNDTGYFEISGDTGLNVINIAVPPFYSAIPSSNSYTFNSFDTLVSQLYALQPQVSADSVSVSLARINPARRGFVCGFQLHYENVGTTTLPASIVIGYNPSHLSYLNANMPGVTNNGNQLTIPAINLSPGDDGNINLYFNVLQTATLGDTTYLQAQATAGTSVMHDSVYAIITGSFDPNDKNATPTLTPQQVAAGTFINYFIRFQNTGNDTAINVVVTDTLDGQLDFNSFQLISTSHTAITKRDGNKISFEFLNIMLPDSNINEPLSHGYIRFRVKPLSNLIAGSIIPNIADIYFDYNNPVTTNNTNTTIPVNVVPLTLLNFSLMPNGDNKALLRWNTSSEINTLLFEIERSANGVAFERIGSIPAVGQGDHTYSFNVDLLWKTDYFRLKIIDRDNRFSYSEIKKIRRPSEGNNIYIITNPVRKTLTINCTQRNLIGSEAVLFDHVGKKLMVFKIKGGLQDIHLPGSSSGLYYLRTLDGTKEVIINAE